MNTFYARSRAVWRRWLQDNAASAKEVWLVYYKKASVKPTVAYAEAVEEAICFGWIDGMIKRIDEERYAQRFSPRNPRSQWSSLNMGRAKKMIAAGLMTPAGLAVFDPKRIAPPKPDALPPELQREFERQTRAWQAFRCFPESYQRMTIAWVACAKKQETQRKRLQQLIETAAKGERIRFM